MEYEIINRTNKEVLLDRCSFWVARDFIAGQWTEETEEHDNQYNKIMDTQTLDELNSYAKDFEITVQERGINMANRILVDKLEGVHHIFFDNGSNTLQEHGAHHTEMAVHATLITLIDEIPGKVLTDQDVIEFTEIKGGRELPVQIIKMSEYLEN